MLETAYKCVARPISVVDKVRLIGQLRNTSRRIHRSLPLDISEYGNIQRRLLEYIPVLSLGSNGSLTTFKGKPGMMR